LSAFPHFLRVHLGGTLEPVVDQIQIPLRRRLAALRFLLSRTGMARKVWQPKPSTDMMALALAF
jgi:hypothetical protein